VVVHERQQLTIILTQKFLNVQPAPVDGPSQPTKVSAKPKEELKVQTVEVLHCDLIKDVFWTERPYLLQE